MVSKKVLERVTVNREEGYLSQKQWIVFGLLFFFSYILLFLCKGPFWDDWVVVYHSPEQVYNFFSDLGTFGNWNSYLYNAIYSFNHGILLNRFLSLLCYTIAAVFFEKTLRFFPELNATDRFYIVVLFAIFPVDFLRTLLNQLHYAIPYASYFVGLYVLGRYEREKKIYLRPIYWVLFFFSFTQNALLAYQVVTYLFLILLKRHQGWKKICIGMLSYIDIGLLTIIFWVLKGKLFPPQGIYAVVNYNTVTLKGLLRAPLYWIDNFKTSFFKVIFHKSLFTLSFTQWLLSISLGYFISSTYPIRSRSLKSTFWLGLLGIAMFCVAMFPYNVVGKIAGNDSFD